MRFWKNGNLIFQNLNDVRKYWRRSRVELDVRVRQAHPDIG